MEYAYGTDAGLCREINEDKVHVFRVGGVFTVALLLDGMGGANGGRVASATACELMTTELELRLSFLLCTDDCVYKKSVEQILRSACDEVNYKVWKKANAPIQRQQLCTQKVSMRTKQCAGRFGLSSFVG